MRYVILNSINATIDWELSMEAVRELQMYSLSQEFQNVKLSN